MSISRTIRYFTFVLFAVFPAIYSSEVTAIDHLTPELRSIIASANNDAFVIIPRPLTRKVTRFAAIDRRIDFGARAQQAPVGKMDLGAFQSQAIAIPSLPLAEKWRKVANAKFDSYFSDTCARDGFAGCNSRFAREVTKAADAAKNIGALAKLRAVNVAVNSALTYRSDQRNWGMGDKWATPEEMSAKGAGDCEDFAIAKMWALRELGFSRDALQLVVLQKTDNKVFHAILVAHVDGKRYVLDNLSNRLTTDMAYDNYMPIMSFVAGKSYIHGFKRGSSRIAEMPKDFSRVLPGSND